MVWKRIWVVSVALSIVACSSTPESTTLPAVVEEVAEEILPTDTPVPPTATAPPTATPNPTQTQAPTPTEQFPIGQDLIIDNLRAQEITGSEITFESEVDQFGSFTSYVVSYISEGNRIYGLLTVPNKEPPEGGFKAIVFNHGYIPPQAYVTTERYVDYVNFLAWSDFVVFKIDMRGHGNSEGEATGAYFSPAYTIDAIAALKSLQTLDYVDPQGIGMWGHSMAGNIVLRAMLVEPDVQAGVIWAGAVYSYDDFAEYAISDPSFDRDTQSDIISRSQNIFDTYGRPGSDHPYWEAVSLTNHLEYLNAPLQLHHATNDPVVTVRYSRDLASALEAAGKTFQFYEYDNGGHNIYSPAFDTAIQRTIAFFRDNL